jgi:hypothetical protein
MVSSSRHASIEISGKHEWEFREAITEAMKKTFNEELVMLLVKAFRREVDGNYYQITESDGKMELGLRDQYRILVSGMKQERDAASRRASVRLGRL